MSRKTTLEEITNRVNKVWNNIFIVADYKSTNELYVKDAKTLIKYKVTVSNFLNKKHDPRKIIEKKDKELVQNKIFSIYGDEFCLVDYINSNNITIKDKNDNTYKTTYSHLIKERKNPHNLVKKYTHNEIVNMLAKKTNCEIEIVDQYHGMQAITSFKCLKCGNIFQTTPTHILHEGTKCPFCAHQKISEETCILNSPYKYKFEPYLTREQMLHYMPHTMQKIEVVCPICKTKKLIAPDTIFSQNGIGCICGDSISYPNKFMYNLLSQCNVEFEREKKFPWSDNRVYDFYIKRENIIVEMHGLQHYVGFTGKDLPQIQNNDNYKKELALKHLNCAYIEINASKSNLEFIKEQIIKSKLLKLLNIDALKINFKECDKFAIKHTLLNSLVDDYNHNKDFKIKNFAEDKKISISLAYKLLNQAIQYNLISDYNKVITTKKKVRCIETGELFNSIADANRINHANISKAIKNHSKANNFHWEYVE